MNALLAKLKESDRRLASMYESQLAASVPALVADTKNSAAPVKVAVKNVGHFGASMPCARPYSTCAPSSVKTPPWWWPLPA